MISHFKRTKHIPPNYFVRDSDGDFPVSESYVNDGVEHGWLTLVDIRENAVSGKWEHYYSLVPRA